MKNWIIIFTIIYCNVTKAQDSLFNPLKLKLDMFKNEKIKDGVIYKNNGEEYKIINTSYEKGLKIKKNGEYVRHGVFFTTSNGNIETEIVYNFGCKISYQKYYTDGKEKGKLYETGQYKDCLKDGIWLTYNRNGDVLMSMNFKNDLKNGTSKIYSTSNGKIYLSSECEWKDGLRHGSETFYGNNGRVYDIDVWVNGVKVK